MGIGEGMDIHADIVGMGFGYCEKVRLEEGGGSVHCLFTGICIL